MDADAQLIRRAKAGEERAFHELFLRHRSAVTRTVFRRIGPSPDLEDVVQEVFLHVYRSLHSFRGQSRFSTWLYRLASNVALMHLRKKRSRPKVVDVEVPETPHGLDPRPLDRPDEAMDRAARVRALYRLLAQLDEKKREVVVLHDFEGVAAKRIAERLGIPVLTVRTRLFYGRKQLYASLATEPALRAVMESLWAQLPGKPGAKPSAPRPEVAE